MHTAPSLIDLSWIFYTFWIKQTRGACSRVHSINQRHSERAALQVQPGIFTFRSLHWMHFPPTRPAQRSFYLPTGRGLCRRDLNTKTKQHNNFFFFHSTSPSSTTHRHSLSTRTGNFIGRVWRYYRYFRRQQYVMVLGGLAVPSEVTALLCEEAYDC